MFEITILGAVGAGFLSFASPCILPLAPPYLCFIGGVSIDQMMEEGGPQPAARKAVVISSIAFVFGLASVFIALGATASFFGQFVGENMVLFSRIAGVIIILLGLHFLNVVRIPLFYREARVEVGGRPAGILGAYVVGLAFGFGWTPCAGPFLAMILFTAAQEQEAWRGAGLLAAYALGMGLPFILIALMMGPFMRWMAKYRRHMGSVEKVMGTVLIVVGVMFVTGDMRKVGYWMLEAMPWLGGIG